MNQSSFCLSIFIVSKPPRFPATKGIPSKNALSFCQSQLNKDPPKKKQKRLLLGIAIARIDEQLEKISKEKKKISN